MENNLTHQKLPFVHAFNSLVVMALDSMLRRANRAQAGIQRLHDQALVGAARSRVGIRLGLPAFSKPDDDTGRRSGEDALAGGGWRGALVGALKIVENRGLTSLLTLVRSRTIWHQTIKE